MTELAVIGTDTFAMGFRLAGIKKIWPADDVATLEASINAVMRDPEISILVMETADVMKIDSRIRHQITSSVKPTLVAVGADEDNTLRDKIKQAVGVDLW